MGTVLLDTLRGLCGKSGWCYAVFWKLKKRSRMFLTWEDCCYDHATVAAAAASTSNSASSEENPVIQCSEIALLVSKMSYHIYTLGEGIIGRVAFNQKHQWVFAGGGKVAEKYPTGWAQQFSAGIKTIAVIAVADGVLQLGSVQTIPEDMKLVLQVKAIFQNLHCIPGAFFSDLIPDEKGSFPLKAVPDTRGGSPLLPVHSRNPPLVVSAAVSPSQQHSFQRSTPPLDCVHTGLNIGGPPKPFLGVGRVELSRFSANPPPAETAASATLQTLDDIGDCTDWDFSGILDDHEEENTSRSHEDDNRKRARTK